jgi:hypothetical protein
MTNKVALLEKIKLLRLMLAMALAAAEIVLFYYLFNADTISKPTAWLMAAVGVVLLVAATTLYSVTYKRIKQL